MIVAPAADFLLELLRRIPARHWEHRFGPVRRDDPRSAGVGQDGRLRPERALWELEQILEPDTIFLIDSGEHYFFATHYLTSQTADSYIVQTGLGSMGCSLGGALGAQMARPNRRVAVICGDGGFAMAGSEVTTAALHRLPILYVVFNDGQLGMVEHGNRQVYGRTPGYPLGPMDIAAVAAGMGARTVRVSLPGEIAGLDVEALCCDGPAVIEVLTDSTAVFPKGGRLTAMGEAMGRAS